MKLTKKDIIKFGTEKEKKSLKEVRRPMSAPTATDPWKGDDILIIKAYINVATNKMRIMTAYGDSPLHAEDEEEMFIGGRKQGAGVLEDLALNLDLD